MRITKWGEYGILCSLFLASKQAEAEEGQATSVSAQEIADAQAIPLQYTHQILQRLRKGDIIKSVRGPKGGYQLTREAKEIDLKTVLEASEGATFEIICETNPPYGEMCGSEQVCGLSGVWRELKEAIDGVLMSKNLASLLENHSFHPGELKASLVTIQSSSKETEESGVVS